MNETQKLRIKAEPRSAVVIGAGVIGVTTAYALARRGIAVTLIDKAEGAGQGSSFANGAQLSYAYTEALANPALLRHLPTLALGQDPAFRLKPALDLDYLVWLLAFLRNSTKARFRANTLAGLCLGLESRLAMQALLERHPLDFGHQAAGKLAVYEDPAAFAAAGQMVHLKRENGAVQEILGKSEAIKAEPALAARPDDFAGAIFTTQEELGDPYLFCNAMIALLAQDYGVTVRLGVSVARLLHDSRPAGVELTTGERIEADQLVLCAGFGSRAFLRDYGLRGSLMPMKGYSFTAPLGDAAPKTSITDVKRKIVFCPLNGTLRVAGLAELGARDVQVDSKRLADLKRGAQDSLPQAADFAAMNAGWAGLRPMTANSLPIIKRVSPGLAVNIGHGMLGWTYAMGSAERVSRLVMGDAE